MDDVLEGGSPNAGRFCGYCYHPLTGAQPPGSCAHCGRSTDDWPPATKIPREVFAMYRAQLSREGWVVRGIAWGGLTAGVVLGLLPIAFFDVSWWTGLAFFAIMAACYIGFANLANSIGDAIGYGWGQRVLRGRWAAFVRQRDQ